MSYEPNELTPEQLESIKKPIEGGETKTPTYEPNELTPEQLGIKKPIQREESKPGVYRTEEELQVLAEVNEKYGDILERGYKDPVDRAEAKDRLIAKIIEDRHQKPAA